MGSPFNLGDRRKIHFIGNMIFAISALCLVGLAAGEPVSVCRPTGERYFISDSVQCDRFHMCDEDGNLAAEFLCQDGLVYEPISKQCGLPFKIDCLGSGRTQLQEPQGTGRCLRLNGKWPVEGTCDQYIGQETASTPTLLTDRAALPRSCTGLLVLLLLDRAGMLLILIAEPSSLAPSTQITIPD